MDPSNLWEALRDRLKDPFLFAFSVLTVAYNWQAFYLVVRPEGFNADVIKAATGAWNGWWGPTLGALGFTVVYPVAHGVFVAVRTWIQLLEHNVTLWIETKQWLTLAALRKHPDYLSAVKDGDALKNYLPQLFKRIDPQRPGGTLVIVAECPDGTEIPRFMIANEANSFVRRVTKIPDKPDDVVRIVFAFDKVGDSHVLCAEHQGLFPWPSKYEDSWVLALDPNTLDIVPVEQGTPDSTYPARVIRQQGDGLKHLARLLVRGKQ